MPDSLENYRTSLVAFAERVPELLARHAATARLALEVEKLEIAAQLERRFTLAVVGRMRAGKSTLLNALIGQRLAPVGVVETTATVNWFEHGAETRHVLVHWRQPDRAPDQLPLEELQAFVGRSERAEATAYLRFFAPVPLLERVRIVDTPGTGSTLDEHERVIGGFLEDEARLRAASERLEKDTQHYGGRADAVVLVLPATAKEDDARLVDMFGRKSRLPGQGAYNSLAVIQKWEALNVAEPEREAQRLADLYRQRLEGKVAEVLPVSGILAQLAADVPDEAMDRLAFLATRAAEADLETLLRLERRFTAELPGAPLDAAAREELYAQFRWHLSGGRPEQVQAWSILAFALRHARRHGLGTAEALRTALRRASRLDELLELLERRFFKIASLIQAGSVLKKALEPCEQALLALRDGYERRKELAGLGDDLARRLPGAAITDSGLMRRLAEFVERGRALVHTELDPLEATWRELDQRVGEARATFGLLLGDIAQLELLNDPSLPMEEALARDLRLLFGMAGVEPHQRLGLTADTPKNELLDRADALQARVAAFGRRETDARLRRLATHAEDRLQALFNLLEGDGA